MANTRSAKLNKQFLDILHGKQTVNRFNAGLFLEGLYTQPEPVTCIDKVIASKTGLASLQTAVFADISLAALSTHSTQLILYLRAPSLRDIGGGQYVEQVIKKLASPQVFWRPFYQAFLGGQLKEDGQLAFAWLLLQLISLSAEDAEEYRTFARDEDIAKSLIASPNLDIRNIGHKLKHVIETVGSAAVHADYGPGGRHDNDHVDFRHISILPTADEITCRELAFMRTATEVDALPSDQRVAGYLDNQFRLYREDMLYELREELQIALGQKKGRRHRSLVLEGLTLVDMYGIARQGKGRNEKWGIVLRMRERTDLWFFLRDKPKNRKKYLLDDRKLIKDGSMAALIIDGTVIAFPSIRRDENFLSKTPPELVLQFTGAQNTIAAMTRLRNAQDPASVKLVQIDTAVFSFEPVLKALKEITSMPLAHELVAWEPGSVSIPPQQLPHGVIESLRRDPQQDLKTIIDSPKSIILDNAQAQSLLSGLSQRVSIIQGPPGESP